MLSSGYCQCSAALMPIINLKLVEDGEDENQGGYHTTGTYELTKDELVLKQTIIDMYEEKKATFGYTEKLRRKK